MIQKHSKFGDETGKIKTLALIRTDNPLDWRHCTEQALKDRFLQWTKDKSKMHQEKIAQAETSQLLHWIDKTGQDTLKYGRFIYVPLKNSAAGEADAYMIFNLPSQDAAVIAGNFGQASFMYGEVGPEQSTLYYFQIDHNGQSYGQKDVKETVIDEDEAAAFFVQHGFKFSVDLRVFADRVPEVMNATYFKQSMDDTHRNFMSRAQWRRLAYDAPLLGHPLW